MAIPRSLAQASSCLALFALSVGCGRQAPAPPPAPPLPQTSGTLAVDGLSAPVRIVRDRWGVPHIYAENQDDLFFAQGFVQAQDRLFQMDLWKKSVQGRLSQVLGSNFIERDAMTRRIQYRGDLDAEWESYGSAARGIAAAFVRGINAWVVIARAQQPEEFALAGWPPEFWRPEDLLNRTDAFLASVDAADEVLRARLVAAVGAQGADRLLSPGPNGSTFIPAGLEPAMISYALGDALRRVGTTPFFTSLAAPVSSRAGYDEQGASGSNAWAIAGRRSATGSPLLANDPHQPLEHPSRRYLVHLIAPGWNVIGATSPWLPGVAIGHNDRIAWGMTSANVDVQDLFVEKVNPDNPHQIEERGRWIETTRVHDAIPVKGGAPFVFDHEFTPRGPIVAVDRERHLAFTLRWTGFEPGTAAGLGALALDQARSWPEFRAAAARWKMPAVDVVYADVDGNIGRQIAALVPARRSWNGSLPAPAWTGAFEWAGWRNQDDMPWVLNPPRSAVTLSNGVARMNRLIELLTSAKTPGLADFRQWQHDTLSWNAERLVPLLAHVPDGRSLAAPVEEARQRLLAWDRRLTADSGVATLYVLWERALLRTFVEGRLEPYLAQDYLKRQDDVAGVLVPALRGNEPLLFQALGFAVDQWRPAAAADQNRAFTFTHPLGATEPSRRRFNVGPFARGGSSTTLMAMSAGGLNASVGASFAQVIDLADWDRSEVINAPGQAGAPGSPHFSDLAKLWTAGEYFQLAFSDRAVQAREEASLTLTPRVRRQ